MNKTKKPLTLTLMCGIARSGKSTWIKNNRESDEIVVEPDEVRREIFGTQYHNPAEPFVWAVAKSMVRLLLKQGVNVIIDATNTTQSGRTAWGYIAKEYGAAIRVIWVRTSLEECKRRNEKSIEGEQVPESVIDQMFDRFEAPGVLYGEEWFNVVQVDDKP